MKKDFTYVVIIAMIIIYQTINTISSAIRNKIPSF